ncbi:glutamine amidotransferase [Syntrophobacteraceae bacterium DRH4]|nr:glutamine amidotransferase [Desulfoferrobacter suflitae]
MIIKVGRTLPSLVAGRGDFDDWIVAAMGIPPEQVNIVEVSNGETLPDYREISGIVITGSHDMVTDHLGWSEYAAKWLPGAVDRRIPTLGICYGHQLLAYSLGGRVANNPLGNEIGTVAVRLDELAQDDLLLGGMGSQIRVHVFHTQSVLDLPPGARGLAESDLDRLQAFVVGDRAWGVQFHPEFDADIVVHYINHYREILLREGADPDACMKQVADSADGSRILKRFYKIVTASEAI